MGISLLLVLPVLLALFGAVAGHAVQAARGAWPRGSARPPMWPRKGPCFGEPIRQNGRGFGGRTGDLYHRNPAGSREYMP